MGSQPTLSLHEFLERYNADDNEWWRLQSGDHQNLFEEAVELSEELRDKYNKLHAAMFTIFAHPEDAKEVARTALFKQNGEPR